MIWPSDSVSQCHVDQPHQRRGEKFVSESDSDEHFSGDDLADEMSRLDISSLPPSPIAKRRQTEPNTEPTLSYPVLATPKYWSLNSIQGSSWDTVDTPGATAAAYTARAAVFGTSRTANDWSSLEYEELDLSPELVDVIFRDITRKKGGKRFARLGMGDSGRWHVVRYSSPTGAFPNYAS